MCLFENSIKKMWSLNKQSNIFITWDEIEQEQKDWIRNFVSILTNANVKYKYQNATFPHRCIVVTQEQSYKLSQFNGVK